MTSDMSQREECDKIIQTLVLWNKRWPADTQTKKITEELVAFCDKQDSELASSKAKREHDAFMSVQYCTTVSALHEELRKIVDARCAKMLQEAKVSGSGSFMSGLFQSSSQALQLVENTFNKEPFSCNLKSKWSTPAEPEVAKEK